MRRITESELLLVSKSNQEKLRNFSDGVQLAERSGLTIRQIQIQAAKDRLALARLQLKDAKLASQNLASSGRAAVSRAYYAMYHAARAASFIAFGGDDHEAHSALSQKFPVDFPDADVWKNRLKDARLERNRADYDPYPRRRSEFHLVAPKMIGEAEEMIKLTREYLRKKSI